MYIALNDEQKRISINDAVQGNTFFCPVCLEKMFIKAGSERARHFSHYPKCECNDSWNGQYDMSDWHFDWQSKFPAENQEVVVEYDGARHRADVLTDRTVIEFQQKPLSASKFNERNVYFHNIGYKTICLYDMRKEYENGHIIELKTDRFSWDKTQLKYTKYSLSPGQKELFFQIGDDGECIFRISKFFNDSFIIKQRYTKESFLIYIGLINGICLPPLFFNSQLNDDYLRFAEKYGIELNYQQQKAVQLINGANLLIAVPGSGKTTTMVARMGYMIYCKGIRPENILAVTYTKSATNDIWQRFADMFDSVTASHLNIRTINSLCEQIIKRYVEMFNRKRFTLLKDNERTQIIKEIYKNITGDNFPHESDIIESQTVISYIKNMMLDTPELRSGYLPRNSIYEELYKQYCGRLKEQSRMDFDDQLVFAKLFLENKPELLSEFQNQYQYICVDEVQDTSKIQHEIIRLLAERYNNIFMVGDEDQSIYGFRAAYPRALLEFTDTYSNPYVMFLETNYRSTKQIVAAAQKFISENNNRHSEKIMLANRTEGEPIERIAIKTKHEQYSAICDIAKTKHSQIAVLYRNNDSAIPVIDAFLRENIPYKRLRDAGENFFTSKVVQDLVFFLRFAVNQNDADAFMQIYYKCGYSFRKEPAIWSCKKAPQKKTTITDELICQMSKWPSLMRKAEDFKQKLLKIGASKPHDAIDLIFKFWYYTYAKEKELDMGKVDILSSLAVREDNINNFLQRLEELPHLIGKYKCTDDNPVILSTVHSAKGLEFDTVYIVDVYDGCLPHCDRLTAIEKDKIEEYEEERRIFYVAITRAINELHLFYIEKYGSEFIDEIIPLTTPIEKTENKPASSICPVINMSETIIDISDITPDTLLSLFTINTKVRHDNFGVGIITDIDEINGNHIVAVQFRNKKIERFHLEAVVQRGILHLIRQ